MYNFCQVSNMSYGIMFQEAVSTLETVIDVPNPHENIEQTSRNGVLQSDTNAEDH